MYGRDTAGGDYAVDLATGERHMINTHTLTPPSIPEQTLQVLQRIEARLAVFEEYVRTMEQKAKVADAPATNTSKRKSK